MKFEQTIFRDDNPWFIGETRLSYLILNFDQSYLGRSILVPKNETPDLESLEEGAVGPLMLEVAQIGRHIKTEFKADRMNYASLGNVVAQLHWHLIPRYEDDLNWGAPPWPVREPRTPSDAERQSSIQRIRRVVALI
ncbi:HIT family protein [Rhizobium laguerreae]|uniref:HIT family protein n=1 Tax=Rhizobium laguerreae TaxID=1076926 RepID=UPI001C925251|nr:HIT family protein [Rhizobium laguerreae]MBY3150875.1 HIT family protein [Rhizobium laguerreae]MBY3433056.1 HIT family protein [Rhizobium laguerreae]